jgi:hypothetical protein
MKQADMFGAVERETQTEYTKKIGAPHYEPRGIKPHELELCDTSKTHRLINEIESLDLSSEVKRFLTLAAHRHTVFNYEKIADYYANAPKEVQELMEKSALVIIDFERAILLGYVRLTDEMRTQYVDEYES